MDGNADWDGWDEGPFPLGIPRQVPSPGGWEAPTDERPGWAWVPDCGASERLDRVPWWVRAWARTPLLDRSALVWLWHHGGFDVEPAPGFVVPEDGWSTPEPSMTRQLTLSPNSPERMRRLRMLRHRYGFRMVRLNLVGWLVLLAPATACAVLDHRFTEGAVSASVALGIILAVLTLVVAWIRDRRRYAASAVSMEFGGMDGPAAERIVDRLSEEGIPVEIEEPDEFRDRRLVTMHRHADRVDEVARDELGYPDLPSFRRY